MARSQSFLAAFSLAALLGVTLITPALANPGVTNTLKIQPTFAGVTSAGGIVIFTVTAGTVADPGEPASKFVTGLTLSGADAVALNGWLVGSLPVLNTATPNPTGIVNNIAFNIPAGTSAGIYKGKFGFTNQQPDGFGGFNDGLANQGFTVLVTDVPEPGAVAFGVIAAGSILGLVARRRKMA